MAIGFALHALLTRLHGYVKRVLLFTAPAAVFAAWLIVLKILFPSGTYAPIVDFNLGMPFEGLMIKARLLLTNQTFFSTLQDIFFYGIFLVGAIFIIVNFFKRPTVYNTVGVSYVALIIMFAPTLLLFPKEYTRNFIGLSLFLLLDYMPTKSKITLILLVSYALSSVLFFSKMFFTKI